MNDLRQAASKTREDLDYVDGQLNQITDALDEVDGMGDTAEEKFRSLADRLEVAVSRLRVAAADNGGVS